MSHENLKGWLEDYVEDRLSSEDAQDLEQHLAICHDCRDHLGTIRLTRGIVRTARLDDPPMPLPGFARAVLRTIEQQKENYFFWSPLRVVAFRFIPAVAALAVVIGLFAYLEMSTTLKAQLLPQAPLLESSLELSSQWGQEVAIFSESISQDQEQVVTTLLEGQTNSPDQGKEPKR